MAADREYVVNTTWPRARAKLQEETSGIHAHSKRDAWCSFAEGADALASRASGHKTRDLEDNKNAIGDA